MTYNNYDNLICGEDKMQELVVKDLPKVSFEYPSEHIDFLYLLLAQREDYQCISHKKMPSHAEHTYFVLTGCWQQYHNWEVIMLDGEPVGSVYLTNRNEIGIQIDKNFFHVGIGEAALVYMLDVVKNSSTISSKIIYANINPNNERSVKFFNKHGFKLLQVTYGLDIN